MRSLRSGMKGLITNLRRRGYARLQGSNLQSLIHSLRGPTLSKACSP